jgi:chromosome segregation and condensation protein ScpB
MSQSGKIQSLLISEEEQAKLLALMLVVSNKIVNKKDLDKIWEEFSKMVKLKILELAEEKGMEKGLYIQKINTAQKLLSMNFDVGSIMDIVI